MKKITLFLVMMSIGAACFAFGAKNGGIGKRMNGDGQMGQGNFGQRQERCGAPYLCNNADLTAEQREKMDKLQKEHRDEMFNLSTEMQKLKIDQRVNLKNHEFKKAKNNAKQISDIKEKMEQKRIENMEDCYNVLTKEQKDKLN